MRAFVAGKKLELAGATFIQDFASQVATLYRTIRVENSRLRNEIKKLRNTCVELSDTIAQAEAREAATQAAAPDVEIVAVEPRMGGGEGQVGEPKICVPVCDTVLPNIEKINLNTLGKKPCYFNGEDPMPSEWIREYKDAISDNQWSAQTAIYYFKHFLKDDATAWFNMEVKSVIRASWTWNDLHTLFEANYLGRAESDRLRLILNNMIMGGSDRAANFIPRVQQYLLMLSPRMNEPEQVNRISEKLRPEFANAIS